MKKLMIITWLLLGQTVPTISFVEVPQYGSFFNLRGRVLNAGPEKFAVAVYIKVNNVWWTKPYLDSPITKINEDGSWECDITTGGVDETATLIAAYLIPTGFKPPLASGILELSEELERQALAKTIIKRDRLADSSKKILVKGFCYGPFRDKENPDMGIFPLSYELREDLGFIPKITKTIRTYGCANTPRDIPDICERLGIDCYVGAWLSKYKVESEDEAREIIRTGLFTHQYTDNIGYKAFVEDLNLPSELDPTIGSSGPYLHLLLSHVKGLIVGNEVLLRKDLTEDELIFYLKQVKKAGVPVTTADTWEVWLKHPRLASEVDFLMIHIHPYWEGCAIDEAARHVVEVWQRVKDAFPNKRIVIGETGWPSGGKTIGKAVANEKNQARFFEEFTQLAEQKGIEYFYFELFDEQWKDEFEGQAGAHWGVYNSDGSLKQAFKNLFPNEAQQVIMRPAGEFLKIKAQAPLVVYKEGDWQESEFRPSGFMGDRECLQIEKDCPVNPRSGKNCLKIAYNPNVSLYRRWSGIYWLCPLNNWGDYPGYELFGASKLTFWARGEKGKEMAEFKTGGIRVWQKPYCDSFGPVSTGVIVLGSEWKKYTLDLKGCNTSNVIGGFCFASNYLQNPAGCTIYLDDIQFEP